MKAVRGRVELTVNLKGEENCRSANPQVHTLIS